MHAAGNERDVESGWQQAATDDRSDLPAPNTT